MAREGGRKGGQNSSVRFGCTWLDEPGFSLRLVTRLRRAGRALRVCLRDAHVSADSVFGHFVDDELLRNMRPGHVEKNGFVYRTILLLKALVFHNHGHAEQIPLLVYTLQLDGHIGDLLRAVSAGNGELGVVALAQAPELVNFVVVRSEEHTSELQSRLHLECRLMLEKIKYIQ